MRFLERAIKDDKIEITGKSLSFADIDYFVINECPYVCGYEKEAPSNCCCNNGDLTCEKCWMREERTEEEIILEIAHDIKLCLNYEGNDTVDAEKLYKLGYRKVEE